MYMDKLCSACQAGVPHDCQPVDDIHPDDKRVCDTCGETFSARSAKLGARNCPTCDRRAGRGW